MNNSKRIPSLSVMSDTLAAVDLRELSSEAIMRRHKAQEDWTHNAEIAALERIRTGELKDELGPDELEPGAAQRERRGTRSPEHQAIIDRVRAELAIEGPGVWEVDGDRYVVSPSGNWFSAVGEESGQPVDTFWLFSRGRKVES